MTDLVTTLPQFSTKPYSHLLPSLEKACITTTDLLMLDAQDVARRANVPLLDLRSLVKSIVEALHTDLGLSELSNPSDSNTESLNNDPASGKHRKPGQEVIEAYSMISTLEPAFDTALAGGIPTGYITEITGESGSGKTQLLLTLLLSVQLPRNSGGLSAPAIYISTEHALSTTRLRSLLSSHPSLSPLSEAEALSNVLSLSVPDLESQDHILTYQLPIAIRRHKARLVILDSVTANYRAEFENTISGSTSTSSNKTKPLGLTERTTALNNLGHLLRNLARDEDCAIVVANQVADRFSAFPHPPAPPSSIRPPDSSSPATQRSSQPYPSSSASIASGPVTLPPPATGLTRDVLSYDHQLNFFSGWCPPSPFAMTSPPPQQTSIPSTPHTQPTPPSFSFNLNLKTPSLGLTWSSIIACRIVLTKSTHRSMIVSSGSGEKDRFRRRFKIAFAAWCEGTVDEVHGSAEDGIEFEIWEGGIRAAPLTATATTTKITSS